MTISNYNIYPTITPVRLASSSNIAGNYFNGVSNNGVGAFIKTSSSTLSIDSVAVLNGDRVLLQNQDAPTENGIYVVSGVGFNVILTRAQDFQSLEQFHEGQLVSVAAGTANFANNYILVEPLPNQLGVDGFLHFALPSGGGGGFGTAAYKNVTNNGLPLVSSVTSPVNGGFAVFGDVVGTIRGAIPSTAVKGWIIQLGDAANGGEIIMYSGANANTTAIVANSVVADVVIGIPDPGTNSQFILADFVGTQTIHTGQLTIANGNLEVGTSAGETDLVYLTSYAAGNSAGGISIYGSNTTTGDFFSYITNDDVAESVVFTLGEPGAPTSVIQTVPNPIVNGNLVTSVGKTFVDAGFKILFNTGASSGGLSITITDANITTNSKVFFTFADQGSPAAIATISCFNGSFIASFTADPSACNFYYMIIN